MKIQSLTQAKVISRNFFPKASIALAFVALTAFTAVTAFSALNAFAADTASSVDPDANYDRLDGTGKSGKTVQVIEWEGNLEIHVYPSGSTAGIALKLDKRNKDKPVMVIGYRFDNSPQEQLVRRAILAISLNEGFKVYKDPTESEFDKFIISNNGLSGQVVAYRLDPPLKQLYPDGSPALAKASTPDGGSRSPASVKTTSDPSKDQTGPVVDDAGGIKPFFSK